MKRLIRASLLASALALTVAGPALAEPGSTTHESTSTCRTDESTGFTYCFTSEMDTTTKEKHSGASDVRKSGTTHSTVVDAEGNVLWSYHAQVREHDVVQLASDGSAGYLKIDIHLSEEITDAGVTWCTKTHVVIRGDAERTNQVSTKPGPC
jgi:hypothetical protein